MDNRHKRLALTAIVILAGVLIAAGYGSAQEPITIEALGEKLYFDTALSMPDGQACASCHDPVAGFDDPDSDLPVSEGIRPHMVGNRNSPISAYAMYAPPFHFDDGEGLYIGGQFWDGRATGGAYGDPLADQASGPPLNPLEMANPNKQVVVNAIKNSDYADLFEAVWGKGSLKNVETAYDQMALSIAAFERTSLFAAFDSKYDAYLQACLDLGGAHAACADGTDPAAATARMGILNDQEWQGLQLFVGENDNDGVLEPGEGAFCSACHVTDWVDPAQYAEYGLDVVVPGWGDGLIPPLFTDYSYDNLGAPKNWDNPFLYLSQQYNPDGADFIDLGLGGALADPDEYGKFKVMPLRNIGVSGPYLHNGLFSDLQEVVHFYNTRDDGTWAEPEFAETVNHDELGSLGLSAEDEAAITAFMLTLTDGYMP